VNLYNRIQNIGVTPKIEKSEAKIIRTHNGILFVSVVMLFPFSLLFLYLELEEGLLLCLLGFLIVTIPVWMNHLELYVASRISSFTTVVLLFLLGIFLFGYDTGFEYGILSMMVLPILYFRRTLLRLLIYRPVICLVLFSRNSFCY
jgi:hypothetical protein